MALLERYLQAIRFWLPAEQQDDILEELAVDIRSEIEEREAQLGRRLDEAEMAALLKRRGRPMSVANRYLPQRHLIGPLFFPAYRLGLKTVFFACIGPWVVLPIALILFSPSYRGDRSTLDLMGSLWGTAWIAGFSFFAVVTLIFAIVDRACARSGYDEDWDPLALPAVRTVRDRRRIPRSASIVEIVVTCMALAWWVDAAPLVPAVARLAWTRAPVWQDFRARFDVVVLALSLGWIAMACVNLWRPVWTRTRLALRAAAVALATSILLVTLLRHATDVQPQWTALRAASGSAGSPWSDELQADLMNVVVYGALAIAAAVSAACLVYEAIRLVRWNRTRAWTPGNTRLVGADPPRES